MNMLKYMGKALLTVVLPVAFCVVATIIINALFASVGALMGHNTFQVCFESSLDFVLVAMVFFTAIATIYYFAMETGS